MFLGIEPLLRALSGFGFGALIMGLVELVVLFEAAGRSMESASLENSGFKV